MTSSISIIYDKIIKKHFVIKRWLSLFPSTVYFTKKFFSAKEGKLMALIFSVIHNKIIRNHNFSIERNTWFRSPKRSSFNNTLLQQQKSRQEKTDLNWKFLLRIDARVFQKYEVRLHLTYQKECYSCALICMCHKTCFHIQVGLMVHTK